MKQICEAAEARSARLELTRRGLEGELQRAQLRATETEAEVSSLQERLNNLRRELGDSEERAALLKVCVRLRCV